MIEHSQIGFILGRKEDQNTGRPVKDVERLTLRTPDIEEISRPKRPPPMQANVPTIYWMAMNMSRTRARKGYAQDFERCAHCTIRE